MANEHKRRGMRKDVAAIILLLFGYGACYVTERDVPPVIFHDMKARIFTSRDIAVAFIPAAWVESQLIGQRIGVGYALTPYHGSWNFPYVAAPFYRSDEAPARVNEVRSL